MLTQRNKKLALIHIAKKQIGITDDGYRALLEGSAGVNSASKIQNDQQYFAVMRAFKKAGYKPPKSLPVKPVDRGRFCSERQRYYIKGLWELASRNGSEKSLSRFLERITGINQLRWLSKPQATKVILALRDIALKAGYNPDGPWKEDAG